MTACFVTATGTGVGKTALVAALLRHWRGKGESARALKPVISGFDPGDPHSDTRLILDAQGQAATPDAIAAVSPWRFRAPLSPDIAAGREGRGIDFDALVAFCRAAPAADRLLIEGVGGAFVPLTEDRTVADWIAALDMPAIVVAGSYLGTISHTLATVESLRNRGIPLAAVVVSESPDEPMTTAETQAAIARFLNPVPVTLFPRLAPGGGDTARTAGFAAGFSVQTLAALI